MLKYDVITKNLAIYNLKNMFLKLLKILVLKPLNNKEENLKMYLKVYCLVES